MHLGRTLIVNADDFGLSQGVNRGIVETHERGIVTSASLMVRWPAAAEAADYGRRHPTLSLGLHVDVGEWFCRDGCWFPVYEVVPTHDAQAVEEEVHRQLATFRSLAGRDPTHLDSHQHQHLREPLRSILKEVARELSVPLRHCSSLIHYCGEFHGQTTDGKPLADVISVDGLTKILAVLPPGITELSCHPGNGDRLDTMYSRERLQEKKVLCHPHVRAALADLGIQLRSFHDVRLIPPETAA